MVAVKVFKGNLKDHKVLIVRDTIVGGCYTVVSQHLHLLVTDRHPNIMHAFRKLNHRKGLAPIVVDNAKGPTEPNNSFRAAGLQYCPQPTKCKREPCYAINWQLSECYCSWCM